MAKVTENQRVKRYQSPYTICIPIMTDFKTTVIQLTGIYYQERLVFDKELGEFNGMEIVEERLDLGTHSNLKLANKEAAAFRADPELYYSEHLRKKENESVQAT